jgi:zinc transport system substrate-binding protein
VNVLMPASSDPHSFSPKPAQIKALANSDLYFGIGFPFEDSIIKQVSDSVQTVKIVHTQAGIDIMSHDEHNSPNEPDPHVWTSPKAMLVVAENTYSALIMAYPQHKAQFDANYAKLASKIQAVDNKFKRLFNSVNKIFLVYHPAYGYLARDYGLTQLEVARDGKEPKAMELMSIISAAKKANAKLFIVSPQQSSAAAQTIAKELGIELTVIDNLAYDWIGTMDAVYTAFDGGIK